MQNKKELGEDSLRVFRDMLAKLTTLRESIKDAMVFAINHSEQSNQISNLIVSNLKEPNFNPKFYIANLFLISDILFNCNTLDIQYA